MSTRAHDEIFDYVQRRVLMRDDEQVQVFEPELTLLQSQALEKFHVPETVYFSRATA